MSTTRTRERAVNLRDAEVRTLLAEGVVEVRRKMKPQPDPESFVDCINEAPGWWELALLPGGFEDGGCLPLREIICPLGAPGDRLWGRENWADAMSDAGPCICYRANLARRYMEMDSWPIDYARYPGCKWVNWASDLEGGTEGRWRSRATMPRWASRLSLVNAGVRVERAGDGAWEWVVTLKKAGEGTT